MEVDYLGKMVFHIQVFRTQVVKEALKLQEDSKVLRVALAQLILQPDHWVRVVTVRVMAQAVVAEEADIMVVAGLALQVVAVVAVTLRQLLPVQRTHKDSTQVTDKL
jgi:hypothetical protein